MPWRPFRWRHGLLSWKPGRRLAIGTSNGLMSLSHDLHWTGNCIGETTTGEISRLGLWTLRMSNAARNKSFGEVWKHPCRSMRSTHSTRPVWRMWSLSVDVNWIHVVFPRTYLLFLDGRMCGMWCVLWKIRRVKIQRKTGLNMSAMLSLAWLLGRLPCVTCGKWLSIAISPSKNLYLYFIASEAWTGAVVRLHRGRGHRCFADMSSELETMEKTLLCIVSVEDCRTREENMASWVLGKSVYISQALIH